MLGRVKLDNTLLTYDKGNFNQITPRSWNRTLVTVHYNYVTSTPVHFGHILFYKLTPGNNATFQQEIWKVRWQNVNKRQVHVEGFHPHPHECRQNKIMQCYCRCPAKGHRRRFGSFSRSQEYNQR